MMAKVDWATFTIGLQNRIVLTLPAVVVPGTPLTIRVTPGPGGHVGLVMEESGPLVSPDGVAWAGQRGPIPGWGVTFIGSGVIEMHRSAEESDAGAEAAFTLTSDSPGTIVEVKVELISTAPPATPAEWAAAKAELGGLLGGLTDPSGP